MARRIKFRRIRRNQLVDVAFINELYDNDNSLDAAIEAITGQGSIVTMRGNYELSEDGTKYNLIGQTGNGVLPASIPVVEAGEVTINFVSSLKTDKYDVHLTAGVDASCLPGKIGYGARSMGDKTENSLTLWMLGAADVRTNLTGFTVSISYGG